VAEIGRAIHPLMSAGQVEGGTAQALGWALLEEVVEKDGRMVNAQLTNYIVPTSLDTPPIDVTIMENPYRHGAFGAKGIGEMPMDGGAPAVANAVRSLGLDVRALPITPERVLECASSSTAAAPTSPPRR
jgi:CO/xanthine dehydrogenase Mo-binding subunit